MGDTGEDWAAKKKESQARRAYSRKQSPKLLEGAGIQFDSKNEGGHLIVKGNNELIEFWPGTGKWLTKAGKKGRGVHKLMSYIKEGTK